MDAPPTSLNAINRLLKKRTSEGFVLKTIYIGNLEWKTTIDELKDFFAPYGQVSSAEIKKDRETGMAKGFGFVTMENADKAILELNGKEFRGRTVKLNEAREREHREYNPRREDSRNYPPRDDGYRPPPPRRDFYPARDDGYRPPPRRDAYPPRDDGYRPPPPRRDSYPPRDDRPQPEYWDYQQPHYNPREYQPSLDHREPPPPVRTRRPDKRDYESDRRPFRRRDY